jgi:hypothetical protein
MQPPPDGVWGLPAEKLAELPGYDPDVAKNRSEARAIMEKLGYGPDKRLAVTVSTHNTAGYRDPAVIAIDQRRREKASRGRSACKIASRSAAAERQRGSRRFPFV